MSQGLTVFAQFPWRWTK